MYELETAKDMQKNEIEELSSIIVKKEKMIYELKANSSQEINSLEMRISKLEMQISNMAIQGMKFKTMAFVLQEPLNAFAELFRSFTLVPWGVLLDVLWL